MANYKKWRKIRLILLGILPIVISSCTQLTTPNASNSPTHPISNNEPKPNNSGQPEVNSQPKPENNPDPKNNSQPKPENNSDPKNNSQPKPENNSDPKNNSQPKPETNPQPESENSQNSKSQTNPSPEKNVNLHKLPETQAEINDSPLPIVASTNYSSNDQKIQLPNFAVPNDQKIFKEAISRTFSVVVLDWIKNRNLKIASGTAWIISKATNIENDWTYYVGTNIHVANLFNDGLYRQATSKTDKIKFYFGISPYFKMVDGQVATPKNSQELIPYNESDKIQPFLVPPFFGANLDKTKGKPDTNYLPFETETGTVWQATDVKYDTDVTTDPLKPLAPKALDFAVLKVSFNNLKNYGIENPSGILNNNPGLSFSRNTHRTNPQSVINTYQWLINANKLPDLQFASLNVKNFQPETGYITGYPGLHYKPNPSIEKDGWIPRNSSGFLSLKIELSDKTIGKSRLQNVNKVNPAPSDECKNAFCSSAYIPGESPKIIRSPYYTAGVNFGVSRLNLHAGASGSLVLNSKGQAMGIYWGIWFPKKSDENNIFNPSVRGQIAWLRAQGLYDVIKNSDHSLCNFFESANYKNQSENHVPAFCA